MPSLETVLFTGTHADAYLPLYNGNGVWTLYGPDNGESCLAAGTTEVDLHLSITLPSDEYSFIIIPHTFGTVNMVAKSGAYQASGAAQALLVNMLNPSLGNLVPVAGAAIAFLIVCKGTYKVAL